ncbi:GntR family transcriptional regulator [Amycolatopsis sp. NPDC052450]|uniref:GntR family transcriptional regulator n=1 Tax=unclassified Amycolatopsis TaxID=2618356 RepID=UPI0037CBF001
MVTFHLDKGSGVATYVQLVQQVKNALRLGLLEPGDRLPTAKEVVAELAINPNTVLKAYRELEREGLVEGKPGLGTFVQKTLGGASFAERTRLRKSLGTWVRDARESGLDQEDVEALFTSVVVDGFRGERTA